MVQEIVDDAAWMKAARINGAIGADWVAYFGEQESQEVGNLRCGANRRASGPDGIFLFDGNGGPNVEQPVDIGPIDLVEKHTGIGRERFHIAPLAFGEERVECERGLAGP